MKRFLSRASVAGLSAALVAGVALVAAPAASAAQIGTLTFNGLTSQSTAFTVTTSAGCPTSPTNATNFLIRVSGGNLPVPSSAPNITGNTAGSTIGGGINSGPFTATASATLANYAAANGLTQLGDGTYLVELVCRTALSSTSLGEFSGQIVVSGGAPVGSPLLTQQVTTSTVVSASPAAGDTATPASFTANVTPASAVGTVQFKRGTTNIGSPVAVSGGVATSPPTGLLAAGSYSITAEFTGGSSSTTQFGNSVSAAFPYTVAQVTAATVTNLALSGLTAGSVEQPNNVGGIAVVTAGGTPVAGGSCAFFLDGQAAPFATDATAADGFSFSSLGTSSLTVAGHSVVAVYTGVIGFGGSTSPPATFTVTAPAYTPDVQYIETVIAPGTLIISTPYTSTSPLQVGTMVLNPTATEYSASAPFTGISVADTRPGNLPYTLSAISSNLTKNGVAAPNANETINAQNVGLTGLALISTNSTPNTYLGGVAPGGSTAGQNFTAFNNAAAPHVAAGAAGTAGLGGTPKVVLHANTGLGTTVSAGTLTILAPTNTLDGTYRGTVTFTIIGS